MHFVKWLLLLTAVAKVRGEQGATPTSQIIAELNQGKHPIIRKVDANLVRSFHKITDTMLLFFYKRSTIDSEYVLRVVYEGAERLQKTFPEVLIGFVDCDQDIELAQDYAVAARNKVMLHFKDGSVIDYPPGSVSLEGVLRWADATISEHACLTSLESEYHLEEQVGEDGRVLVYRGVNENHLAIFKELKGKLEGVKVFLGNEKEEDKPLVSLFSRDRDGGLREDVYEGEILFEALNHFVHASRPLWDTTVFRPSEETKEKAAGGAQKPLPHKLSLILLYRDKTDGNKHFSNIANSYKGKMNFISCQVKATQCANIAKHYQVTTLPSVILVMLSFSNVVQYYSDIISATRLARFIEVEARKMLSHTELM